MGMFKKAVRSQTRLRMALAGPAGSGKTKTGLIFAHALGQRVAVIDTEHASACKYQGDKVGNLTLDFDHLSMLDYAPHKYIDAIRGAGKEGYDVLFVDSLSHAWTGKGGILDIVDKAGNNKFSDGWKKASPQHADLVEAILASPCHVIASVRSKMDYVVEEDERGRKVPRKVGMAPVQRNDIEYEFDIYGTMDWSNTLTISKSRCDAVNGAVVTRPGPEFIAPVKEWLESGTPPVAMVSSGQLAEIESLRSILRVTPEHFEGRLINSYQKKNAAALNVDQAADLLNYMRSKLTDAQRAELLAAG